MPDLYTERCVPCRRGTVPLSDVEIQTRSSRLPGWNAAEEDNGVRKLSRSFKTADFGSALACANRIGELATEADHHPQIVIEWGRVSVSWWTHTVRGLHRNDFIMAGRVNAYSVSKAALNMIATEVARELRQSGIPVLTMHPGHVATDMGGPGAPVQPADSARGIAEVIGSATIEDSGRFLDWRGKELPW